MGSALKERARQALWLQITQVARHIDGYEKIINEVRREQKEQKQYLAYLEQAYDRFDEIWDE